MEMIIQALVSGLAMGSIYALIALGYNITYATTLSFNFGQGEFLMIGALVGLSCYVTLGLPFAVSLVIAIFAGAVCGYALEKTAIRPVRHILIAHGWVMSTIGVAILLKNTAILLWGANQLTFPSPFGNEPIRFLGAGVLPQEIFVIAATLVIVALVEIFQRKTILGKAVRATAFNQEVASLMGINVNMMIVGSFVVSSALACLGGVMVAPITTAWAYMGGNLGLKAFVAAILGGLESSRGCVIGGFLLGITEFLIAVWRPELRDFSIFVLLILILLVRPTGLLGVRKVEKV
jgi:branched-chain amino acid transport system permease protein